MGTIKWGDVANLEDYEGGRDYDALKKFAKENLKPMCSPANIDLCDDEKKKEIAEFQAMSAEDLSAKIEEKKAEIKTAEETFTEEVKKLQETYQQLQKDKDEAVANVKKSGLGSCRPCRLMQRRLQTSQSSNLRGYNGVRIQFAGHALRFEGVIGGLC